MTANTTHGSQRPATPRNMGDTAATHMSPVAPAEDMRTVTFNRISWSAVLAGVLMALVTQLILNMLGVGVGVATLDPGTRDNPQASTFSIAAGIWWTASGIVASFVGGYIAGRLCGSPRESTAGLHGVTAWAVTTLVIFYLLTSALGSLLGGVYNTVTGSLGGAGRTAATAAHLAAPSLAQATDSFGVIERQIRGASGNDAGVAAARVARDQVAQALSRAQNGPIDEARARMEQFEQQYRQAAEQAKEQATRAADAASKTVSMAALLGGIGLILGGLAAFFGGRVGAVDPRITSGILANERRR